MASQIVEEAQSNPCRGVYTMKHDPRMDSCPLDRKQGHLMEDFGSIDAYMSACHPDAQEVEFPKTQGDPETLRYFLCKSMLGKPDYIRACWEQQTDQVED